MEHLASRESLTEFFGVEATLEYPDIPFERNTVQFDAQIESTNVWFKFFAPGGLGELRLRGTPLSVVKLTLSEITHLAVRKTAEDHCMHVRFASESVEPLTLYLRPRLLLFWGNDVGIPEQSHLEPVR